MQLPVQLTLPLLAAIGAFALIGAVRPPALAAGLVDEPGRRKHHALPTPLAGGIGAALPCLAALFFVMDVSALYVAYAAMSVLLLAVGVYDDLRELNPYARFVPQVVAAGIMALYGGVEITSLGNLFGLGVIELGWLSVPFTVFAIVGMINAFNMIDGLDGLSGTVALAIFATLGAACWLFGAYGLLPVLGVLAGGVIGFLAWNVRVGRSEAAVFLGDSGSTWLGFTLGVFTILATQRAETPVQPVLAIWILMVPVFDAISLIFKRTRRGRSAFDPDHNHLHHLLLRCGLGVNRTVLTIGGFTLLTGTVGIVLSWLRVPAVASTVAIVVGLYFFHRWTRRKARRTAPLKAGVGTGGSG